MHEVFPKALNPKSGLGVLGVHGPYNYTLYLNLVEPWTLTPNP